MDNTRVDLTEYYRGNSLRKGLGRIKKYIVFFGYRCGYTIIALTPEEPHKFCGRGIKGDTIYFQYIGFSSILKCRSTREVLILVVEAGIIPHHQSLRTLSSLLIMVTYRYGVHQGPSFNSFPMGPFFCKKMKKSEKRS